ncbi:UNVERIFIED_CONTAM: hypothetical protein K2H54_058310 [Gekko kuhli]
MVHRISLIVKRPLACLALQQYTSLARTASLPFVRGRSGVDLLANLEEGNGYLLSGLTPALGNTSVVAHGAERLYCQPAHMAWEF